MEISPLNNVLQTASYMTTAMRTSMMVMMMMGLNILEMGTAEDDEVARPA